MNVSTEVQRTLVKSPPELWAELSDPEALARHLGELGELRITAVEPESRVEWETENATGVVHLKQSGWGTKVTLSATRVPPETVEEPHPEPVAEVEREPDAEAEHEPHHLVEAASEPKPVVEAVVEAEPLAESEPGPVAEPEPQLRFFARLFRRRRARRAEIVEAAPEPETIEEAEPEPEFEALAAPEPTYPQPTKPTIGFAGELEAMEAQMAEETTELLTGVLDRLGAAHHRPFSRG